jgi:hypothetical protein
MRAAAAADIDVERITQRKRPMQSRIAPEGWTIEKYNTETIDRPRTTGAAMQLAQSSSVAVLLRLGALQPA